MATQATVALSVTPDNDNDLDASVRGGQLYIGVTGDVEVDMTEGGTIVFKNVPVGFMPVVVDRVRAANTTATEIIAVK